MIVFDIMNTNRSNVLHWIPHLMVRKSKMDAFLYPAQNNASFNIRLYFDFLKCILELFSYLLSDKPFIV